MNVFDVLKLTHFTINQELMNHPSYIVIYMSQQRGHRLIDILLKRLVHLLSLAQLFYLSNKYFYLQTDTV